MATYFVRKDGSNSNDGLADSAAQAWLTIAFAIRNANNGVLANGDTVYVAGDGGTYTENTLTPDRTITMRYLRAQVIVDGTGGGAGTDVFTALPAVDMVGFTAQNAVDDGYVWASGSMILTRCGALSCASDGFLNPHTGPQTYCFARACGGSGFNNTNTLVSKHAYCEAGDCTVNGFVLGVALSQAIGCLAYDCGGDGFNSGAAHADGGGLVNCTSEGNTGDGWDGLTPAVDAVFINNAFTNNTGVGAKSVAATTCEANYNHFHGNGTDRTNFPIGPNDTSGDPLWVAAASDNYTPGPLSPLLNAGYNPWKASAAPTIGAVGADAVASADFPDEGDVRAGVVYGDGTLEGDLVVGVGGLTPAVNQ